MDTKIAVAASIVVATLGAWPAPRPLAAEDAKPANQGGPFPNDKGPDSIDVSAYPKEQQETYRVFLKRCSTCHTPARALNAQFLQLSPEEQEKAKREDPELFKDKKVVEVDDAIWSRYVKRMMSKPGSTVGGDGKKIFELMVYDSKQRKLGANALAWRAHRKSLLEKFKQEYTEVYEKLFGKDETAQPVKTGAK
ncbi:MAG: hypothetical protein HY077_12895 [Elusimicrobia bacterium]|nr:hypothetical protein [Elusimicrobiota bacterium]